MKRNIEFLKNWVSSLRSDKYEQGNGSLKSKNKYCCLGVACDLYEPLNWTGSINDSYSFYIGRADYLPDSVRTFIGLSNQETYDLAVLNDNGSSFKQIADQIEKRFINETPTG